MQQYLYSVYVYIFVYGFSLISMYDSLVGVSMVTKITLNIIQ